MALWRAAEPLILASKSAVRRSVLEAAGVPVEVIVADIDERGIEQQSGTNDPGEVAKLLAGRANCYLFGTSAASGDPRLDAQVKESFEKDRFINPGEDFTPEPPKAEIPTPPRASGFGAE